MGRKKLVKLSVGVEAKEVDPVPEIVVKKEWMATNKEKLAQAEILAKEKNISILDAYKLLGGLVVWDTGEIENRLG